MKSFDTITKKKVRVVGKFLGADILSDSSIAAGAEAMFINSQGQRVYLTNIFWPGKPPSTDTKEDTE